MIARNFLKGILTIIFAAAAIFIFAACDLPENTTAVLWTDRPEFVFYGEQFNASQDKYKVEVHYYESPARELTENSAFPDIAVASWLKSASTRNLFRPLDDLFSRDSEEWSSFYPRLLALGKIDDRQYLLPVSYNIHAMVFSSSQNQIMPNAFTISMEEIMELGKDYNIETNGVYTRMGFTPSWNDEFLFLASTLFNTGFRESSPIAWDPLALERSMVWIQKWITEANTGLQAEDDFIFKYCYDPPAKLASSGRILFAFMDSSELFILPEERRINLDFRWIAGNDSITLDEGTVYYGIHKKTRAKNSALAFTRWFFRTDTQRLLLEISSSNRFLETSFGIGGGFSAMRPVTEQIFPLFYPSLLGRMPPGSFLTPPAILPRNWMDIKEKVILPYLRDRIRHASAEEIRSLERRIIDWNRLNRN